MLTWKSWWAWLRRLPRALWDVMWLVLLVGSTGLLILWTTGLSYADDLLSLPEGHLAVLQLGDLEIEVIRSRQPRTATDCCAPTPEGRHADTPCELADCLDETEEER